MLRIILCEEKGIIPKFVGCDIGVNWFKLMGKWKEKEYIPKPGDIIFFDWDDNEVQTMLAL